MANATTVPASAVDTRKVTKVTVAEVQQLIEVRAEIARLEKVAKTLTSNLKVAFEVDEVTLTSKFTTLIHNAIEVARIEWREKKVTDEALLKSAFPEAYEATRKVTRYSIINTLYKKK